MDLCKCYRCHQEKPAEEFAWRRKHKNQRDSFCRLCRAAYKQEHYAANKARYIAQAAVRKRQLVWERTAFLIEYFQTHGCVDCGELDPLVLEFDHVRGKDIDVSKALHTRGWEKLMAEIARCQVVCANCHRRRTARRRRTVKVRLLAGETGDS
jgi:hypothetical protein